MTQFDIAAAALVLAFAYSGYRRGLTVFVLHLTGGVLALALAAALAPLLAPHAARAVHLPAVVAQPVAVVALTAALRLLFGFAVRELAVTLRAVIRAVPPLALLDHLLGVVPGAALGAAFVVAVTAAALTLPLGQGARDAVAASWVARSVVTQPAAVVTAVRRLWDTLVVAPPRLALLPLAVGVGGLWLGAFAAYRLGRTGTPERGAMTEHELREAPTRRVRRLPAPAATETADPLALPRAIVGLGAATLMMAALLLLSRLHS